MKREQRFGKVEARLDKAERTPEGYIRATIPVTRTGVFPYRNDDGTLRLELRHPEDVFDAASLESLKLCPVQVEHRAMLDASNIDRYKVGHLGESVQVDGNFVRIPVVVDGAAGIAAVDGGKKEVSCGYELDVETAPAGAMWDGKAYTHRQRNIRYNHLAITDRARLGPELRLDSETAFAVENDSTSTTEPSMNKKIHVDGVEYEAPAQVVIALEKANGRADTAEGELVKVRKDAATAATQATAALDAEKGKLAASDADKKKAEDALAALEKDIPTRAAAIAKDRADLIVVAEQILPENTKFDSMDNAAIRSEIIKVKYPDIKLDGKSADFVEGLFVSAKAGLKSTGTDAAAANRAASAETLSGVHKDSEGKEVNADTAREAMVKRNREAYKTANATKK
jgi:hypothetical protein